MERGHDGEGGGTQCMMGKRTSQVHTAQSKTEGETEKPGSPGAKNGKAEQERPHGHSVPAGHL